MRHLTLFHLVLVAAVIPPLLNAQGFYRNLPIGHPGVTCHPAIDGGLFLTFSNHPESPLVKLDNTGEVVWAKSIAGISGMRPAPDGGVILISPSDGIPQGPEDPYNSFLLKRLNADGEMVMNKRIAISDLWGEEYDRVDAAAWGPDGDLYLCLSTAFTLSHRLLKFDVNSELLWSRTIYNYGDEPFSMTVLPDGGLMFTEVTLTPGTMGKATRLGPDGNIIWNRYLYTNAPALFKTGGSILVDDDGSLLLAFTASSGAQPGNTHWVVVGKMDVDANMVWSHAYDRAPGGTMSVLGQPYHSSAPARVLPNGNYYFGTQRGFEFTPVGLFVREKVCTSPTLAPGFDDITHLFTTWPTADGWLQYGTRRWTDPVFGNFVQMPLLGRTALELDSTCFWTCTERTDITPVPPPPDIFAPTPWNFTSYSETFTTEDWPVETLLDVTMDLLEDACELPEIVLLQTSVEELEAVATLLVFPNPVVAGQAIQVEAEGPLVLEVLDARGRVISSQLHSAQPASVRTAGWDAGLYFLRATRPNGQVVGTGRVMVQ